MIEGDTKFLTKKLWLSIVMAILLIGSFILPVDKKISAKLPEKNVSEETTIEEQKTPNQFENIELIGKSAIIWDIKNKASIFELNADQVLPMASLVKLLLAVVSYDLLPYNTEIVIKEEFLEAEGDTGLLRDEKWLIGDLIDFSLVVSSNDGARAIASVTGALNFGLNDAEKGRESFVGLMNERAKSIGMEKTSIENETGLDIDKIKSGAYSSAREISMLINRILSEYPDMLQSTAEDKIESVSLSGINHVAKNTNSVINSLPGIIASKTGYTELAGGNLAVVFDTGLGNQFIAVIMGSTFDGRFSDMQKLIEISRKYSIGKNQ